MRLFQLALICLLVFIQYKLWFGHNGVKDYTRLKLAVNEHQQVNEDLLKRNKLLKADVDDLKIGLDGIEERARNELGLIKPGETFYRVLPGKRKQ
ncbi:cell division protein FtsB [Pseudoalteromonas ulvae UL12]|uniref:Cell division protein FtsB n=1 Tax=Pseudoalteromonas ulvae TaxID=107327 RepID=A0A244CQH3_PSEDV|nr:cell division protein FtsB [Pseudoalteromonas ulvae]MBE0365284.1 cell division protein FtsB [Pseudoalteromonas ulvae UL12]OUL57818.1 cell division protein FtsB [Pseudoalteromonas ulvae]